MEIEEIDWEKCLEIANKTGEDDEYSGMTWGSPEEIDYICDCLWAFKRKQKMEDFNAPKTLTEISGIHIGRFRELFDLFMERGFNMREDDDWKEIKRTFFNKVDLLCKRK